MKQEYLDLIYLVGCAVNEVKPDIQRINAMKMPVVFKLAKYHTLTAVSFYALESSDFKPETAEEKVAFAEWQELKKKAITKNMLLDGARAELFGWLDAQHIWHCALKGSVLKDLYPRAGMRQMADNDILFDRNYQQEVHDWFISHDYKCEVFKTGNHDVYLKPPIYNFEMHTSLFGKRHDEKMICYFENIVDRLEKNGYEYHFSDNDFYIYILSHAYKHYSGGGTGLRTLVDFYVYNKFKGESLNRDYVKAECEKLGISEFEENVRKLSQKVFGTDFAPVSLTDEEQSMLAYFLGSGTYGTIENAIQNKLKKSDTGKFGYVLSRMFPDKEFMKSWCSDYAPKLSKLLPVAYIWRLLYMGFTKSEKWQSELKVLRKIK